MNDRSQAEADLVFPPADREAAAQRIEPQLRNVRQRFRRNMKKADAALSAWDQRIGTVMDLAEREIYAERAQLNAGEMHGLEAQMASLNRNEGNGSLSESP